MNNYFLKILFMSLLLSCTQVIHATEIELWLGQVEFAQVRNATNSQGENELVIEWLCRRYKPIAEINIEELDSSDVPIKVTSIENEYFVNTLRTKDMPRSLALKLVEEANKNKPTIIRYAFKVFVGKLNNQPATYIGGGSGGIYTNKLIIE